MRVDCVITEYHRPELLEKTMSALDWDCFNMVIVHSDGKNREPSESEALYEIYSHPRVGQVGALDKLMGCVGTEYFLGLEEDWLQIGDLKEGIAEAVKILEENPKCISVSLRGVGTREHNGHPHEMIDGVLRMKQGWNGWQGFSWAPSIRRLSDYQMIGSYGKHTEWNKDRPWESERRIGNLYGEMGYWSATTHKQYFTHIGAGQSTVGK